jgi:hypothetical protein
MKTSAIISSLIRKKVTTAVLLTASIAAFATFGEGGRKDRGQGLLSPKSRFFTAKSFSLRSNYDYRGSHVLNNCNNRYVILNTNITYQKGNNIYILPIKRKVLLDKVTLNGTSVRY